MRKGAMGDKEYRELLRFCTDHGFICFEYHLRHPDWKEEIKKEREEQAIRRCKA